MNQLPPLRLERRLDSRIWGGSRLGTWLNLPDAPPNLAESWQVYEHNRVVGGPFDGRTLAEVVSEHGESLVGTKSFERYGADFPLLAKFIDAADDLSIQVHPNDTYAHTVEAETGFHGKTEAWHILQAEEGAEVIHSFEQPSDRARCAEAIENGSLMELLRRIPVQSGDTVFVPAGTIHAIRAGIMLFEIQQKSDLTYRVYDYDRRDASGQPRELHIDRALDVINYAGPTLARMTPLPIGPGREILIECPYFAMERWTPNGDTEARTWETSFEILTLAEGRAALAWEGEELELARGESIVLPASLGTYRVQPQGGTAILRCYVP